MALPTTIKKKEQNQGFFDDKVEMAVGFIKKHYKVIIPLQDYSKMKIICRDKNRYQYPPTFDDLSLHMMREGIKKNIKKSK